MADTEEILTNRVKKCVTAIKALVAVMVGLIIALVVFAAAAAGTGLNTRNPLLTLSVIAALGGLAILAAVGLLVAFIIAYKAISALKKTEGRVE